MNIFLLIAFIFCEHEAFWAKVHRNVRNLNNKEYRFYDKFVNRTCVSMNENGFVAWLTLKNNKVIIYDTYKSGDKKVQKISYKRKRRGNLFYGGAWYIGKDSFFH